MSFLKTNIPAYDIIERLDRGGFQAEADRLENYARKNGEGIHVNEFTNWFVNILIAFGAFIAMAFLMFLLDDAGAINLHRFNGDTVIFGCGFYVLGGALYLALLKRVKGVRVFLRVLSFLCLLMGQILLVIMLGDYWDNEWLTLSVWLVFSVVSAVCLSLSYLKYLNAFITSFAFLSLLQDDFSFWVTSFGLVGGLLIALIGTQDDRSRSLVKELRYPIILSVFSFLIVSGLDDYTKANLFHEVSAQNILTLLSLFLFGAAAFWLMVRKNMWRSYSSEMAIHLVFFAIFLGLGNIIVVPVFLMVFGYRWFDRGLVLLSLIFFPMLLIGYYYVDNATLLEKSMSLVGGGTVLLAYAGVLYRKGRSHG